MNFVSFAAIVERLQTEQPLLFALASDRPNSDAEIDQAERALAVTLPTDYKDFVRRYGGGDFGYANVFSAIPTSPWYIVEHNRLIEHDAFVAISDNECGDYYGFQTADGVCATEISFFDHDTSTVNVTEFPDLFEYLKVVALRAR